MNKSIIFLSKITCIKHKNQILTEKLYKTKTEIDGKLTGKKTKTEQ